MEVSEHLIEECIKEGKDKKGDRWIFPIIFTAHQGIELYLKGINVLLKKIKEPTLNLVTVDISAGGHDLVKLLNPLNDYVKNQPRQSVIPPTSLTILNDYVFIFESKTGSKSLTSIEYRFSSAKTGTKEFPNKPYFRNSAYDNITVNKKLYLEWITAIHEILDSVYAQLEYLMECQEEPERYAKDI